jgi:RNA polymerase sigma-70 factor (ECF subfamily)
VIAMHGQPPPPSDDPPLFIDAFFEAAYRRSFEAAYRSSGTAVLGYALRRSVSRDDALDVVAETFAVAWRRREDMPEEPQEVRPWLFGIARRCLANTARSAQRADRLGARLAESFADAVVPDPSTLHEHHTDSRQVIEALDRLSPEDRELVTLIAWEGLTPAQAAAALGVSPGTVRVRLHRARTRLRNTLSTPALVEETDRDH